MDLTLMERGNLRQSVIGPITGGMSLTTNLVQKLQQQNSVTANSILPSPRGSVKSIPPNTEKFYAIWLRRRRQQQHEQ